MRTLESDRLLIRYWNEEEYEDFYEYARDETVGPNAGWKPIKSKKQSKEVIRGFIKNGNVYAIYHKQDRKVIGNISLYTKYPDIKKRLLAQREIGFVINPSYWGNGYAPETVKRMLKYCFEKMELDLVWCSHFDFNIRSKRVIEKCNFKFSFQKYKYIYGLDNRKMLMVYYCMDRKDYFEIKKDEILKNKKIIENI